MSGSAGRAQDVDDQLDQVAAGQGERLVLVEPRLQYHPKRGWIDDEFVLLPGDLGENRLEAGAAVDLADPLGEAGSDDGEGFGGDALGEQQRREARFLVQGLVSRLTVGIEASLRGGAQCI